MKFSIHDSGTNMISAGKHLNFNNINCFSHVLNNSLTKGMIGFDNDQKL